MMPAYGWIGLVVLLVSEAAMLARVEPFWTWHTPIAWTGYILLVDAVVWKRRGSSWIRSAPAEFAFLAIVSIPLWLLFEFYNLFIDNWHYLNLPAPPWRYVGYAWAFATIWPAIFETGDLVASFRGPKRPALHHSQRLDDSQRLVEGGPLRPAVERAAIALGAVMLIAPILWPSPYLAAPVWLGFILLLDPINARFGGESLVADLARGQSKRIGNLGLAGLICGALWEFWNYWSRARWVYTVPILPNLKLFEMPVVGYLGFPAFALECFTMYVFVRRFWRGPTRRIAC
ncbi:MAG: hypothetical protein ACRD1S_17685 [Vicinamibacterales bacterium]